MPGEFYVAGVDFFLKLGNWIVRNRFAVKNWRVVRISAGSRVHQAAENANERECNAVWRGPLLEIVRKSDHLNLLWILDKYIQLSDSIIQYASGGSLLISAIYSCIHWKMGTPLANLHLSLLDRVGVKMDRLADSTERLKGLNI